MAKTKTPRKTLPACIGKVLQRLRAHRDKTAARRYFEKAIEQNGEPETIAVDKSGANPAALEALNVERSTPINIRQNK